MAKRAGDTSLNDEALSDSPELSESKSEELSSPEEEEETSTLDKENTPRRDNTTIGRVLCSNTRRVTQAQEEVQSNILEELKRTSCRLDQIADHFENLSDRLQSVESRLDSIEKNQAEILSTPTSTSTTELIKKKMSPRVRYEIRDVYKTLLDGDERFSGFMTKKRFTDTENQQVVSRLILEVGTLNPGISAREVRDAARRFFQTKMEEESLKSKGRYKDKIALQRKRNRIVRKLESRKSIVMQSKTLSESQKEVWLKVMTKDFISSEESGEEELEDGEKKQIIMVKPLRWRAPKVDHFFQKMDKRLEKAKSTQAKQQTRPRIVGRYSTRTKPAGYSSDFFGFTAA